MDFPRLPLEELLGEVGDLVERVHHRDLPDRRFKRHAGRSQQVDERSGRGDELGVVLLGDRGRTRSVTSSHTRSTGTVRSMRSSAPSSNALDCPRRSLRNRMSS